MALIAVIAVLAALWPLRAGAATPVTRLAGGERIGTAIAVSRDAWDAGSADLVVLARADIAADALAATPLAAGGGPILLTASDALTAASEDELLRVLRAGGPVYLAGGEAALAPAVAQRVEQLGYGVVRLAGPTRVETSVEIARAITPFPQRILVADGLTFAEALLAGAFAGHLGSSVVVLTAGSTLPESVRAYLEDHPDAEVIAIGAQAAGAVSDRSDTAITAEDVFALSVQIARDAAYAGATTVSAASGENFPDALAGGAWAATNGAPLLLVRRDQAPSPVTAYLQERQPARLVVFGGPAAVSDATVAQLAGEEPAGPAVELTGQGAQGRTFGQQADALPEELTALLGPPTADSGWGLEPCTEDYFVRDYRWGVLQVSFRSDGDGDDVRLYGWLLGDYASTPAAPVQPAIATPFGITFDTTWPQLQQLGAEFDPDYGFWTIPGTGVFGELDAEAGYLTPPEGARVTAMGAGSTFFAGC